VETDHILNHVPENSNELNVNTSLLLRDLTCWWCFI